MNEYPWKIKLIFYDDFLENYNYLTNTMTTMKNECRYTCEEDYDERKGWIDFDKLICDAIEKFKQEGLFEDYDETKLQRFKNYIMNTEVYDIDILCDKQFYIEQMVFFEEDEDDYDERRNSFEAFNEWFNKEVRSLEDIERNDEDFNDVVREWCNNNNHVIGEDGIYNMNIKI